MRAAASPAAPDSAGAQPGGEADALAARATPPPRPGAAGTRQGQGWAPREIDWRAALRAGGLVALVAAPVNVLSLVAPSETLQSIAALLSALLVLGGSVIAVGVYMRLSPRASLTIARGLRIGVATGLLMVVARAVAVAITGLLERFVAHGMGAYDAEMHRQLVLFGQSMAAKVPDQPGSREFQSKLVGLFGSPEGRAGLGLLQAGFVAVYMLAFSAAGGAFAGAMRARAPRTAAGR